MTSVALFIRTVYADLGVRAEELRAMQSLVEEKLDQTGN